MDNVFIKLIHDGKINSLEELKQAFRKLAKKTHPDSTGSDKYVGKFIQFKNDFEEAKEYLISKTITCQEDDDAGSGNYRYQFFREMLKLYALDSQFFIDENKEEKIKSIKNRAIDFFMNWNNDNTGIYVDAMHEYEQIKKEKRKNIISNLRKPTLFQNLRPVFFNLSKYHITGLDFYRKQLRNLNTIYTRLEEEHRIAMKEYIMLLIKDLENGPAIFG
jgi:hypothetical protein